MFAEPMDVLTQFPVRKSKKQKQAFREAVQAYLTELGYEVTVEKGSMGSRNLVIGNPDAARYLVTAHYDTPAGLPFPNLITPTNPVTFIAYQFLMVAAFLIVSFGAAFAADALLDVPELSFLVWYIVYFGLLFMMMFGPANKHNANDNTSGVVTVLEIAKSLPCEYREQVCFILFDLEEAGLIGSASHRSKHKKATENQVVLNLDCVGDGDEIMLFPTKKLRKDREKMELLGSIGGCWDGKSVKLHEKGFSVYPSDQKNFPYGVGIAAFRRSKWAGLYCSRIHTKKDTILEKANVEILRDCLVGLIARDSILPQ